MKTILVRCMTMAAIAFWVSSAAANSIDVDLGESSGVQLTITDIGENNVLFSFSNYAGPASLAAIYIDSKGLLASMDDNFDESVGVDFTAHDFTTNGGGPSNLPGGKPLGFSADYALRVEKNTADGIDREGERLGIIFTHEEGVTLASISEKIVVIPDYRGRPGDNAGDDIVLPPEGSPVPEPASLILFGIGTAGIAALTKRRRRNK